MRILIFTPWSPISRTGIRKRGYHHLEILSRTHEVTLLAYSNGTNVDSIVKALASHCVAVHTVEAPSLQFGKRIAQLMSMRSSASFQRQTMYSLAMQRKLDELTSGEPFDVIQVETSQLACFRFDRRSIVVLDEHNIEYELYYRMYQAETSLARRLFNWVEYYKFKQEEIASWRTMSGCVLTSRREKNVNAGLQNAHYRVPTQSTPSVSNQHRLSIPTPSSHGLMKIGPTRCCDILRPRILPRIRLKRPNAVSMSSRRALAEVTTSFGSLSRFVRGRQTVRVQAAVFVCRCGGQRTRLKS